MKKLLVTLMAFLFVLACSAQTPEVKALYEKNLAVLKAGLAAFEKEDIETWAASIADNAEFNSPVYGDELKTKAHWKELLKSYVDEWDNLKLNNPIFLPGLDTTTHQMDGSVRFYGTWTGDHKSGIKTKVNFYGSYDFKDGKITSGSEFFDVGGLMNAVQPKK